MTSTVEPLFLASFLMGAELASEEHPIADVRQVAFDPESIEDAATRLVGNYTDDWWRQFNRTTQNRLRTAIGTSIEEGTGVAGVISDIQPLFGQKRARLIAISETTNLMGQGAQETYRQAGFTQWAWRTVRDAKVDPICQQRRRDSPFPMSIRFQRAHPGCRCWPVPVGEPTILVPLVAA